jgi:GH35 family endo-1,4-beta-xylanase
VQTNTKTAFKKSEEDDRFGLPSRRLIWSRALLVVIFVLNIFNAVQAQTLDRVDVFWHRRSEQKRLDAAEIFDITEWKLDDPEQVVEHFQLLPHTPYPVSMKIRSLPSSLWNLELKQRIKKEIKAGTKMQIEVSTFTDRKDPCQITIETTKAPYDKIFSKEIILTKTFEDDPVICSFVVPKTMAADRYSMRLGLSKAQGNVQFAEISLTEVGFDPKSLKAPNESESKISQDQIDRRINRYRKGTLNISVVDRAGKPVPNAEIAVEQTAHKFLFGGSLGDIHPDDSSTHQLNYQKRFLQLFNYATVIFPWKEMEPQRGKVNYTVQEQLVKWCKAHQIIPKGGPLLYDWFCPDWLPTKPAALTHALRVHIADTINHFSADIKTWDVLKEVADEWTILPNAFAYWLKQSGPIVVADQVFEMAKLTDQDPNRMLLYVDWEKPKHREVLNALEKSDNLPDGIGLETRMYKNTIEFTDLWNSCERYKRYEKPLQFSQVTILSGDTRKDPPFNKHTNDWLSTAGGEAKQADYVERFYSILFSHPSVASITWWDLSDKEAYMGAPGGLLRKDGTPKPAFERLRKLIHEEWWTKATLKTDQSGNCSTRAFWGSYIITVKVGKSAALRTPFKFFAADQPLKIIVN